MSTLGHCFSTTIADRQGALVGEDTPAGLLSGVPTHTSDKPHVKPCPQMDTLASIRTHSLSQSLSSTKEDFYGAGQSCTQNGRAHEFKAKTHFSVCFRRQQSPYISGPPGLLYRTRHPAYAHSNDDPTRSSTSCEVSIRAIGNF